MKMIRRMAGHRCRRRTMTKTEHFPCLSPTHVPSDSKQTVCLANWLLQSSSE